MQSAYDVSANGFGASAQFDEENKNGFVQEVRLSSQLDGEIQFVAGLYYEDFENDVAGIVDWYGSQASLQAFGFGNDPTFAIFLTDRKLEQKAIFGEVIYDISESWALTVGARWFEYDRNDINDWFFVAPLPPSDLAVNEKGANYKVNVTYSPNDNSMVYAQWAEGFRVGFGQVLPPPSLCDADNDGNLDFTGIPLDPSVDSDSTNNFELGGKFSLLDNRLTVNTAIYHTDWDEIPVLVPNTSNQCPGNLGVTANAGQARSRGVEVESRFLATPNLQLIFSSAYMETQFKDDGIGRAGDRLPLTPRFIGSLGIQYDFDWLSHKAFLRSDYSYIGDSLTSVNPAFPEAGDYGKWNLRAGIEISQFTFEVYGNNLTNEDALTTSTWGTHPDIGWRLPPRVIGIDIGYRF
jgi:outer membrane receptor protein involved in Fe transport